MKIARCTLSLLILTALSVALLFAQSYKTGAKFVYRNGVTFLQYTQIGTADMTKMINRVQGCLMAKSAAEGLAKAEILAEVKKLHLSKGKTVENAVAGSEKVASVVTGWLQGAVVIDSDCKWEMDAPMGTATVELALTGENGSMGEIYNLSPGVLNEEPAPNSVEEFSAQVSGKASDENYDGLIIDASSLHVKPDTHILVQTRKGLVAYSAKSVDPEVLIRDLMIAYADSRDYAGSILRDKGSSHPLVVSPVSVQSGSEYIVSAEDGLKIVSMGEKGDALQKARVVIVTG